MAILGEAHFDLGLVIVSQPLRMQFIFTIPESLVTIDMLDETTLTFTDRALLRLMLET